MTGSNFKMYFKDTELLGIEDEVALIRAPSDTSSINECAGEESGA